MKILKTILLIYLSISSIKNIFAQQTFSNGIKITQSGSYQDLKRYGRFIIDGTKGMGQGTGNTVLIEANNLYGKQYNQRILFKTAGTEQVVIEHNGKVGIGTSSPASKLHVLGKNPNLILQQNPRLPGNSNLSISAAGKNNTASVNLHRAYIYSNTNEGASIYFGNKLNDKPNSTMKIDMHNGKIGIGTHIPEDKLTIKDGGIRIENANNKGIKVYQSDPKRFGKILVNEKTGTGQGTGNTLLIESGNSYGKQYNQRILFKTADTEQAVIEHDGNVGIGTSSPASKLHVLGENPNLILQQNPRLSGNSNLSISAAGKNNTASVNLHRAYMYSNTNEGASIYFGNKLNDKPNSTMKIDMYNGRVGIGTHIPEDKLTIKDGGVRIENANNKGIKVYQSDPKRFGQILVNEKTGTGQGTGNTLLIEAGNSYGKQYNQRILFKTADTEQVVIEHNGNVGIGTSKPTAKLSVNGGIFAKKVRVTTKASDWPDYVFTKNYKLRPLKEVKSYIIKNNHLPEIPTAHEVEENGIELGEINRKLLKKIEELTLYQIQLLEKMEDLQKQINTIRVNDK